MVNAPIASVPAPDTDVREHDVFISYNSEDLAFVEQLKEAIRVQKLQIWEIGKNLPIGVSPNSKEAWPYIEAGIQNSHIFVFVISPKSIVSNQPELEIAIQCKKDLVLISYQAIESDRLPEAIRDADQTIVDLSSPNPFEPVAQKIERINIYKRLLVKAEEWAKQNDSELLLRGKDLESVKAKLATGGKQRELTALQQKYLEASDEATARLQARRPDVLVSYSRRDKQFVEKLCNALKQRGLTLWVDWENIPIAAPWREELAEGIKSAHNFLFIMGADSVASKYCKSEIEQAKEHQKRIITFVLRKDYDSNSVHLALRERNWLYFEHCESFEDALHKLCEAIKTDEQYVKSHTELLLEASKWNKERHPEFLLQGKRLKAAKKWLAESNTKDAEGKPKKPQPTQLQRAYIKASQDKQHRTNLMRGVMTGLVALGISGGTFFGLTRTAGEIKALVSSLQNKQELDALMVSIKAGDNFKEVSQFGLGRWLPGFDFDAQARVVGALNQSVYNLHEINRLEGHTDKVFRASFSHNGKLIASASQDGTVKLWTPDGTLVDTFTGHTSGVSSIAFSPDDQILASSSYDGKVKLWRTNAAETRENPLIKTLANHQDRVFKVQFSPNGQFIASASADGTVRLWTPDGNERFVLDHAGSPVYNISFSPDSRQLVSASEDGVRLWQAENQFRTPKRLSQQKSLYVEFSPDGERIAATELGGNDIHLWDQTGKLVAVMQGHQDQVNRVAFSHSKHNYIIASASKDNTARLWTREGKPMVDPYTQTPIILRGHRASVSRLQFSPDDHLLATAGEDGVIKLWDEEGTPVDNFARHRSDIYDLDFSPDGKNLISASADFTIGLWQIQSKFRQKLSNRNYVFDVSFSPNQPPNQQFLASSGFDTIKFWSVEGKPIGLIEKAHKGEVQSVSISPDGKLLASSGGDGGFKLWRLNWQGNQFEQAKPLNLGSSDPNDYHSTTVSFSPDGQQLAMVLDGTIRLWRRDDLLLGNSTLPPNNLKQLDGNRGETTSVSFSADGRLLASGSKKVSSGKPNGEVILWNTTDSSFHKIEKYEQQDLGDIASVSLSPDGQFLAAADQADNTVKIWQLIYSRDHRLVDAIPFKSLEGHTAPVTKVLYSPDSKLLASAGRDNSIKLWAADNGTLVTTLLEHEQPITSLSFDADSKKLASASYDTNIFIWQTLGDSGNQAFNDLMKEGCTSIKNFLRTNRNSDREAMADQAKIKRICDALK